jgi:hypothetical protein
MLARNVSLNARRPADVPDTVKQEVDLLISIVGVPALSQETAA